MTLTYDEALKNVKTKTIVAFLRSNDWKLLEKTETSFLLKPPAKFNAAKHTRLRIPLPVYEQAEDFPIVIDLVVNTISTLYEIEKKQIIELFSQSLDEIKAELSMKGKIVAFAD